MDKDTVLKIVRDFGAALEAQGVRPGKIVLFGSFARSEQTAQSDIDLIIELDAPDTDVYLLKNSIREFIASRFNRGVNLAREKYLRPYARDMILKEAIFV